MRVYTRTGSLGKPLAIDAWGGAALAARETLAKQTAGEHIVARRVGSQGHPKAPDTSGRLPQAPNERVTAAANALRRQPHWSAHKPQKQHKPQHNTMRRRRR